ncbi:MAG TPA: ABC transporter ATP-binding protein [Candidatus Acidoferrales bacterium]|nr:ABC transporter ATP-binding protein [Candidatus Acidoferrales bacterium]
MSDFREEEALGKAYDAQLTRRLLGYLRPYKWRVLLALALTLLINPLELVSPYLFKVAVDSYIVPAIGKQLALRAGLVGLGWVTLGFLTALVVGFALQYAQITVMQRVGQQTMYDLRRQIFGHLQHLPMRFYDRSPVGRLVTRVTTDVDALNELFAAGIVTMINDIVLLAMMAALMLYLNWRLALASFAVLPLILVVTMLFRTKVREANRRIRVAIARINAFLQEHISGMVVVQLFNRERKARQQFEGLNRTHMLAYKDAILAFALFYPAVEFLGISAIALLLWFGGVSVLAGTLQLGVLIAFTQYSQRFFRPIQDLSEKFNILQTAMASSERIFKLLDEPVALASSAEALTLEQPRGEIEFRNVWFAYRGGAEPADGDWVLRDVSFRVTPGHTVALVGHTGAGKTTIIQLLLRFYDIQRGQILLDGVDIRLLDLQELRRHFGIVLQDAFLFTGTLESNVRLGTEGIDRGAVERALTEVGFGDFIQTLPGGVTTPVTERGATLSVGQRQLVSFARALAHSPRFLILDEATSSVDTKTELLIREALDRLLEGRTAVVIAHRLSTIQHADRILVLHKGRLREQGSHQELLAQRGIYYRLYQLQYKDQELRFPLAASSEAAGAPLPADD